MLERVDEIDFDALSVLSPARFIESPKSDILILRCNVDSAAFVYDIELCLWVEVCGRRLSERAG
jgi:hypothetical protein